MGEEEKAGGGELFEWKVERCVEAVDVRRGVDEEGRRREGMRWRRSG